MVAQARNTRSAAQEPQLRLSHWIARVSRHQPTDWADHRVAPGSLADWRHGRASALLPPSRVRMPGKIELYREFDIRIEDKTSDAPFRSMVSAACIVLYLNNRLLRN